MRVFGRAMILAALLCAPSLASAAPIGLGDGGCDLVASAECRLLAVDPLTFTGMEGSFQSFGDIALFSFTFLEETRLTATTSSYALGAGASTRRSGCFAPTVPSLNSSARMALHSPDSSTSISLWATTTTASISCSRPIRISWRSLPIPTTSPALPTRFRPAFRAMTLWRSRNAAKRLAVLRSILRRPPSTTVGRSPYQNLEHWHSLGLARWPHSCGGARRSTRRT